MKEENDDNHDHNIETEIKDDKAVLNNVEEVKEEKEEKEDVEENECKAKLRVILDHWLTTTIFSILTIWALFSDDLKMLVSDKVRSYIVNLLDCR